MNEEENRTVTDGAVIFCGNESANSMRRSKRLRMKVLIDEVIKQSPEIQQPPKQQCKKCGKFFANIRHRKCFGVQKQNEKSELTHRKADTNDECGVTRKKTDE